MTTYRPTTSVNTPTIASSTTAMAANPQRIAWTIVNCGTSTLYVLMGSGASATVFHVPLKAGTGTDDGTGGSVGQEQGVIYQGIISVSGNSPRYTVTEYGF